MTMTDPISDLLTRIRNAVRAGHETVDIPSSDIKVGIAKILEREGYIKSHRVIDDNRQGVLRIYFSPDDRGVIQSLHGLERVSKPSRRVYVGKEELPKVLNGLGVAIISTSKGLLTDTESRETGIGGEVLCYIW